MTVDFLIQFGCKRVFPWATETGHIHHTWSKNRTGCTVCFSTLGESLSWRTVPEVSCYPLSATVFYFCFFAINHHRTHPRFRAFQWTRLPIVFWIQSRGWCKTSHERHLTCPSFRLLRGAGTSPSIRVGLNSCFKSQKWLAASSLRSICHQINAVALMALKKCWPSKDI